MIAARREGRQQARGSGARASADRASTRLAGSGHDGGSAGRSAPTARASADPSDFPVHWAWEDGPLTPGLTCVFRVKNEARNLPWVLPPMLDAVQHVVLVDNGSDDGTRRGGPARSPSEHGAADRFTLASLPVHGGPRRHRAPATRRRTRCTR